MKPAAGAHPPAAVRGVALQAAIGTKIVAREFVKAMRKN